MAIVTTEVRLLTYGDEIKRLMRKNDKDRLCRTVADARKITLDETLTAEEKLDKIQEIITRSYW